MAHIRQWLQINLLKLNEEKTEVVVMGLKNMLHKLPNIHIHIGDESVDPTDSVKNIGVIMDKHLNMKEHILAACRTANFHIYNIGRICRYLSRDAHEKLIHAFVSSKFDYGNVLLFGLPANLLRKM